MGAYARLKDAVGWRLKRVFVPVRLIRARFWRRCLTRTVFVGVTGSVGKTTTKDLAVSVLASAGETIGSHLGFNYVESLAKAMLRVRKNHRFAVFEIATSAPGTIDARVKLVRPSIAAMTVVGRDHIKNFDSVEGIAEEKAKLIRALPPNGVAVLNIDDPLVRKVGEGVSVKRIWFGASPEADLQLLEARSSYPDPLTVRVSYRGEFHTFETSLHGTHLAVPVLAAIGIGLAAGMRLEDCAAGLKNVPITPGRMQIVAGDDGVTFVRDDMKAPHWAFQMALDYLRDARATRKVAIIGTFSDYSAKASKLYPRVARAALEVADLVVFVGPHALRALKARNGENDEALVGFTEIEDAHRFLQRELRSGDLVLLKGSNRSDHLVRLILARERTVSCWVRDCGKQQFCNNCSRLDRPVSASLRSPRSRNIGEQVSAHSEVAPESAMPRVDAWLVTGLGNSGEKYRGTPHNLGFDVVEHLACESDADWVADPDGSVCHTRISDCEAILFKASTPINLTGPVVDRIRQRLGVRQDRIVIVHDDADLEIGKVRTKLNGSDGGHKGLRSVFAALRNDGFMPRVRVGARTARDAGTLAKSLVLEPYAAEDQDKVRVGVQMAARAVSELIASAGDSDELSA